MTTLKTFIEKKNLTKTNEASDGITDYEGPRGGTYRLVPTPNGLYGIYSTSGIMPGRTIFLKK